MSMPRKGQGKLAGGVTTGRVQEIERLHPGREAGVFHRPFRAQVILGTMLSGGCTTG
jgi:hypothetical protein